MIKKILSFFVLCALMVLPARAELKVDIVAGGADPISIAVQKFEVAGDVRSKDASMMREVVESDLKRTGLFRIVNHDAFPEYVKMHAMPNFKYWQAIKTQVLVQTKLT
ncbi:MAG: hypothetical protein IJY99_03475, partial [Alphaproteobacteria bacterium]|nr:hypothetical protein [Alphaproteobacteria bacterium]